MSIATQRYARLLSVRRVQLALAARHAARAGGEVAALAAAEARLAQLRGAFEPVAGQVAAPAAKAGAGLRTAVALALAAHGWRVAAARTALATSVAARQRGQAAVDAVERRLAALAGEEDAG